MKKKVIAIDGPAGAGKSTVAQRVAAKLGYTYIDTGAMYRAAAWKVLQENSMDALTDEVILQTVKDIDVRLQYINKVTKVFVDGVEVSDQLRTPAVSRVVSQVARLGSVRKKMVLLQRKMAQNGAIVMDGRDIASYVLPTADVKVFLTASVEERAKRRFAQMVKKGYKVDLAELKEEITARDKADKERTISPLVKTEDAVLLDTTFMSADEATEKILSLVLK
ncbi:(d)CMP kinase [Pectinatus cerevisiiphilus]|uniref:Cytidylate kinase n=1 Tax=Pectinatus cerevisiiphilus TaxID=86956 RepID=A0A4R3KCY0_9FIRM|nr:(d)CMP kinase [Pectinatus cerevisiiphilus]TCS80978.1 cytidylate kinase [Pectinatus cerevisiiphilus]